jgi:hypothetical protein
MYPGASIVDDNMPGATPLYHFKHGASRMPAGSSGLLLTHVGVEKIMGAPFCAPCPGEGLERDLAWLTARAGEEAGVVKLFAHTTWQESGMGKPIQTIAQTTRQATSHLRSHKRKCRFLCSALDAAIGHLPTCSQHFEGLLLAMVALRS